MIIEIDLSKDLSEKLIMIYRMTDDPEIQSVEDYVHMIVSSVLTKMWDDIRTDILN